MSEAEKLRETPYKMASESLGSDVRYLSCFTRTEATG